MENHKHLIEMREFVDRRETQNVEFKESLKLKEEIGKTVSALYPLQIRGQLTQF